MYVQGKDFPNQCQTLHKNVGRRMNNQLFLWKNYVFMRFLNVDGKSKNQLD